ncbi:lamin tail domain-containing protein [Flavihumibacter petaseus]|uniref:LTD domain-containing protein n=1 Tax=Flavihumibacter petaseus NBRC 106054 TaxID=1220578 RepID=A0A0E9MWP0_9BACT|nr:lamin tail domain-containing protein [Flavihumibacter petaseus]GAO41994.1 hypothetical protein FPE01S_01_10070 [Flavihumibacter petaseus NBRC 106054]
MYGQAFQLVITELLPDPEPAIGLPAEEFIELTNVSDTAVTLGGWKIGNSRVAAILPDSIILPAGGVLICCKQSAAPLFTPYGKTAGLSPFPAIRNDGDTIWLKSPDGKYVQAIAYDPSRYDGAGSGGRSVELADWRMACSPYAPWQTSQAAAGGSPGVFTTGDVISSLAASGLQYAFFEGDSCIVLTFDDGIVTTGRISTAPALFWQTVSVEGPFSNLVRITLQRAPDSNQLYTISTAGFSTCLSQDPSGIQQAKLGKPAFRPEQIIINEILFDPPAGGTDYIELFNNGNRPADLSALYLSGRNSPGEITGVRTFSTSHRCLFPGDYIVISPDARWLSRVYGIRFPGNICPVPSLPSWPNGGGHAVLLRADSSIIDEVPYNAGWHHPLISNPDGIALEKIRFDGDPREADSWASGVSATGFGTPGYGNAQSAVAAGKQHFEVTVMPPDCQLRYTFDRNNMIFTIRIYDWNGRMVKTLARNDLCGMSGIYHWNGRDDRQLPLRPGPYLIILEAFHADKTVIRSRKAVGISW